MTTVPYVGEVVPNGSTPLYTPDPGRTYSIAVGVVPEPTTLISGAMLLLPFGSRAVRQLRKKFQAA